MRKRYAILLNIIVSIMSIVFFIVNVINNQLYTVSSLLYVLIMASCLFNSIMLIRKNDINMVKRK